MRSRLGPLSDMGTAKKRVRERPMRLWLGVLLIATAPVCGLMCRSNPPPQQSHSVMASGTVGQAAASSPAAAPAVPSKVSRSLDNRDCEQICGIAQPLHCKNHADCQVRCQSMMASPVCKETLAKLFACLRNQPRSHWECDEDGIGAIREPFCGDEQGRVVRCFELNNSR